jgi:DNA (cytosine-5)-methyltransferase 1
MPLTFIDLFAGIGGFRLAFERAGMRCVFTSEWDPYAQKTYRANFGDQPAGDITRVDAAAIPAFDVLCGGFPCQPFSTIGQRAGFAHPTQGTLFYDIVRILQAHRPLAFLLENVKGLTHHDGGRTWAEIQRSLQALGYTVTERVLDAADYGVPQHRERIYIAGFRADCAVAQHFRWPAPLPARTAIGPLLQTGVTTHSISHHLQRKYLYKKDDGRPEVVHGASTGQVKTLVASYHKIQRLTGTFVADGPTGLRLLTEAECKAIMGFPADYVVPVSRTQMYRQFGNSVAVPVVQAIAVAMHEALSAVATC